MNVTVRVEITTDWDETETFEICQLERPYRELEPAKVGLSLAEGKDVLHRLQRLVVPFRAMSGRRISQPHRRDMRYACRDRRSP